MSALVHIGLALAAFFVSAPQLAVWAWDRGDLALPLTMLALYWCLFVTALPVFFGTSVAIVWYVRGVLRG